MPCGACPLWPARESQLLPRPAGRWQPSTGRMSLGRACLLVWPACSAAVTARRAGPRDAGADAPWPACARSEPLSRQNPLKGHVQPLTFQLLHLYGQLGWRPQLPGGAGRQPSPGHAWLGTVQGAAPQIWPCAALARTGRRPAPQLRPSGPASVSHQKAAQRTICTTCRWAGRTALSLHC